MRILHTADWHLGARLIEQSRLAEQAAFIDHLLAVVREERIELLLVSGDVFDAANPPQEAVALYYDCLRRLTEIPGLQVIITGGNHDSASQLNAPRDLLQRFGVQVFGSAQPAEVSCLDVGAAVVAAVPYLRERDLRQAAAGEGSAAVQQQVRAGIQTHYQNQLQVAARRAAGRPVIAMGHLTVLGSTTSESEREIHIGSLGAVGADVFAGADYVALGHLHRPQSVAGLAHVRYSGSPIPLSFSEVADEKSLVLVEADAGAGIQQIRTLPIPRTQAVLRASIPFDQLAAGMAQLPAGAWVELTVPLAQPEPHLLRQVRDLAAGRCQILKLLMELPQVEQPAWSVERARLDDLGPRQVFQALLAEKNLPDESLNQTFDELLALHEATVLT
jgi:DNA repair protein SbcD/Mre11